MLLKAVFVEIDDPYILRIHYCGYWDADLSEKFEIVIQQALYFPFVPIYLFAIL